MTHNIVFDMGDVLMMYRPIIPCLRYARGDRETALRLKEAIFDGPEWPLTDEGSVSQEELLAAAQARLDTPELKALAAQVLRDWHLDGLWPARGMEQVVWDLHQRGHGLYILSNACLRFREFQYKIPHVELFSGILVSAEERLVKPDPAIYRRLCEKFSLEPRDCLFVDDLRRNVEGAQSVGMKGYWHQNTDVDALREFLGL